MIQLDPTDIFGSAVWEAIKKGLCFSSCLLLGSLLAFFGAFGAETILSFTPLNGGSFLPPMSSHLLFTMPFYVMTSIAALIALPNAFLAVIYYIRTEEPTAKRFLIFTAIQQFALTISFNEWAFESSYFFDSILSSILLWFFHLCLFGLLLFSKTLFKNKTRSLHEEHLMAVSAENSAWRQKLEDAEFIPPPPSGTKSPKARPLHE